MSANIEILEPHQLEAGAVVPHCLDDQYVSGNLFDYMTTNHKGFNDPEVARWKLQETQTEYIRSLVYASQAVINRAFFYNNSVVYSCFTSSPDSESRRQAFFELLKTKAVIPYLSEANPLDKPTFYVTEEGWKAWESLVQEPHVLLQQAQAALPVPQEDRHSWWRRNVR